MDKQLALNNAQDFINEVIINNTNLNLDKPFVVKLDEQFTNVDPNLEVFKEELNKLGFSISKDPEYKTIYNISKIK